MVAIWQGRSEDERLAVLCRSYLGSRAQCVLYGYSNKGHSRLSKSLFRKELVFSKDTCLSAMKN
jgi:hypothetical protein